MSLKKEETSKLRELQLKLFTLNLDMKRLQAEAQLAEVELASAQNEILMKHDGFGKRFNKDYTEIVEDAGTPRLQNSAPRRMG